MDKEIKAAVDSAVEPMMTAFEAFKSKHAEEIAEIRKNGVPDPTTTASLEKLTKTLDGFEALNQKVTLAAKQAETVAAEQKQLAENMAKIEAKIGRPGAGGGDDPEKAKRAEYKAAFDAYCRKTAQGLTPDQYKTLEEYKVLQAGTDTLGGYYLSPAEMANEIIKAVILQSPFRSLANVTAIGGPSWKGPKRTGVFAAVRVGELGTRTETTGYTAGMVEITCPEMYAEVRISEQMIEDSMFNIEAEMQMEFAEQFAVKEGAEFISGTGATNQAEGIMTASGTRELNSGSALVITATSLIDAFYGTSSTTGLKTEYARNATWVMNRATLGAVRKLVDGTGQYLWQPGLNTGLPNAILGAPYAEMPDMPDQGAGLYPIAVGDWRRAYRIVDRVMISTLRDPYTQSGSGQILFRARKRVGGAVVLAESVVKIKCSA